MSKTREDHIVTKKATIENTLVLNGVEMSSIGGYPGANYTGRDYYVNNITGSSGGGGNNWACIRL